MNIVYDNSSVFSNIIKAIRQSETDNTVIDRIEITPTEMKSILDTKRAKEAADDHYASEDNEWKIHYTGPMHNYSGVEAPMYLWVKHVKVVTVA